MRKRGKKVNKKFYNIYFKYISNIGRSDGVRQICKSYDLNPTRLTVKKNFIAQPNLPTLKNQPNLAGWVGLGQFWRVGGSLHTPSWRD